MTRRAKDKGTTACKCPVARLVPLGNDKDGYKMYYCKEHMQFRKPEKEKRNVHN